MEREQALGLVESSPVARLATVSAQHAPHLVPVVFALAGDRVVLAVDAKPKRTRLLKRLTNIEATGRACLLVDHYEDDWSRLWWVRIDGSARVARDVPTVAAAVDLLAAKYPQYRTDPPEGPAIILDVEAVTGWAASP